MRQKKEKKGQAALEFLMTYGWAILVVLTVIGALAYFGVLNPTLLLPEKCNLQMGILCKNYVIVQGSATAPNETWFEFENQNQKGIYILGFNVTNQDDTIDCGFKLPSGSYAAANAYNDLYNSKPGVFIDVGKSRIINVTSAGLPADGLDWTNCYVTPGGVGKRKGTIGVTWYYADGSPDFAHTAAGELLANAEQR